MKNLEKFSHKVCVQGRGTSSERSWKLGTLVWLCFELSGMPVGEEEKWYFSILSHDKI